MSDVTTKEALSYSGLQTALTCPQMFYHRYVTKIESLAPRGLALGLGKVVHWALEQHHSGLDEAMVRRSIAGLCLNNDAKYVQAIGLYLGYVKAWPREQDPFKVIATEYKFEMPLINPETGRASTQYYLHGSVDAVVEDDDGNVCLMEHKTKASSIERGVYLNKLYLDRQVMLYAAAVSEALGRPVVGIIYNVLSKLVRPRRGEKAKTKDVESVESWCSRVVSDYESNDYRGSPIYYREYLPIDPDRAEEVMRENWALKDIALGLRAGRIHPSKNNAQCFAYTRACEYWPLCSAPAGAREILLETEYGPRVKEEDVNVLEMIQE